VVSWVGQTSVLHATSLCHSLVPQTFIQLFLATPGTRIMPLPATVINDDLYETYSKKTNNAYNQPFVTLKKKANWNYQKQSANLLMP
jgi:hypothetical protein